MSPVTLSVFFEGTANTICPITTQVGLFFELSEAQDVTDPVLPLPLELSGAKLKMGFDGCGVTAGLMGTVFAVGLAEQVTAVVLRVRHLMCVGHKVIVNVLGLSRGGIAALRLAQGLTCLRDDPSVNKSADSEVVLNLCLFDPVPGNLILSSRFFDPFGLSTANGVLDVSACTILQRVLSIYPHESLPHLAFHAPILPVFPSNCAVEEDAFPGCHQGAFSPADLVRSSLKGSCRLSFLRVLSFLQEVGTITNFKPALVVEEQLACLQLMESECSVPRAISSYRPAHEASGSGAVIRDGKGQFLNRFHLQLIIAVHPDDPRLSADVIKEFKTGAGIQRFKIRVVRST